ncbi:MAG: hypothetical protein ACXWDG_11290, partial [Aeromicrobium sp.]
QMDTYSILAGWTGASTPVVVRLNDGPSDSIAIYNAADSSPLPLGTISLGRGDYSTSNITFGASGTTSTMVRSGAVITIRLGTPSAVATTAGGTGTMNWTPSAAATDRAGNASTTAVRAEAGTEDADF